MTPTANNPTVVVLVKDGKVWATATNVDPDLNVVVVKDTEFAVAALGLSFNSMTPLKQTQVLSSAASKARYAAKS